MTFSIVNYLPYVLSVVQNILAADGRATKIWDIHDGQ